MDTFIERIIAQKQKINISNELISRDINYFFNNYQKNIKMMNVIDTIILKLQKNEDAILVSLKDKGFIYNSQEELRQLQQHLYYILITCFTDITIDFTKEENYDTLITIKQF